MIKKPVSVIKRDLARKWGKQNGYRLDDRVVQPNKPHLRICPVDSHNPMMIPYGMSSLMGYIPQLRELPQELEWEDDEE